MTEVTLNVDQLPLINEAGYLTIEDDHFTHLSRTLQDIHVFIFVESGSIQVTEADIDYYLTAGDYLFLHAGVHHYGKVPFSPGTRWYYVHFFQHDTLHQDVFRPERATFITQKTYYHKQLRLNKQGHIHQQGPFIDRFKQLLYAKREGSVKQSLEAYHLFFDLVRMNQHVNAPHQTIAEAVFDLIELHKGHVTSNDIASSLHLNYSYISTVFKQTTGQTIQQAKNTYRIEQAIKLFQYEQLNVTEVSERLGFPNPYYFSRVFKQYTGYAPKHYLKQL